MSGIKQDQIGQDLVQTDASASHGNSGGPAIGDEATLVGVMVAVTLSASGAPVQGFNFLIPARAVATFLQGTEVKKPGDSKFNAVWAAAIELFFDGHYKASVAKLTEADKLVPNLVDVKHTRERADRLAKNPPPQPFPWALATVGVESEMVCPARYGPVFEAVGVAGIELTTTFVVPAAEVQPLTVTVTEYVPASARAAFVRVGFCAAEVKPFGPVQE